MTNEMRELCEKLDGKEYATEADVQTSVIAAARGEFYFVEPLELISRSGMPDLLIIARGQTHYLELKHIDRINDATFKRIFEPSQLPTLRRLSEHTWHVYVGVYVLAHAKIHLFRFQPDDDFFRSVFSSSIRQFFLRYGIK